MTIDITVSNDHGNFEGLLDDDHTQYALLAGRTGGQILVGGSASAAGFTISGSSLTPVTIGGVLTITGGEGTAAGGDLTIDGGVGPTAGTLSISNNVGGLIIGRSGLEGDVQGSLKFTETSNQINFDDLVAFNEDNIDLQLNRLSATPDFNINMPIFVTESIDEMSQFGSATNLTVSDAQDRLYVTKVFSDGTGAKRAGLFVTQWDGSSDHTSGGVSGLTTRFVSNGTGDCTTTTGTAAARFFWDGDTANTTDFAFGANARISWSQGIAGTIGTGASFQADIMDAEDGTITLGKGFWSMAPHVDTGTFTQFNHMRIDGAATVGSGSLVDYFGIRIEELTGASGEMAEIFIQGAGELRFRDSALRIFSPVDGQITIAPDEILMCGCESWNIKEAECRRIDAFELQCWRRLLRVP